TSATEALLALKQANVTTVMCLSHGAYCSFFMEDASQIAYEPEWVIFGTNFDVNESQWSLVAPADQTAHLYGVAPWDKLLPPAEEPAFQAQAEEGGTIPYTFDLADAYHNLSILADGIQMAGPHLTPEAFAQSLEQTQFPNPGAGTLPAYQGTIAVAGSSYTLVHDLALAWFDASAPEYDSAGATNPGGWCYLQRGQRFAGGEWPRGSLDLFDASQCR
ncbi:MAG: ABC transporter substrate-binding protein, partial [Mycobacteriales bacterium]